MNAAASLMNDTARTVYTYADQVPYLNIALNELQEWFEQNEIPVVDTVTANPINVPAGTDEIAFNVGPALPELPDDFIEPQIVWESPEGAETYTKVTRVDFLPRYMEGVEISQFLVYVWQSQKIKFMPANADIDIKFDYIRNLFTPATDENSVINVINAQSFLTYRTAALIAEFIGENKTRADELNVFAGLAMDRAVSIGTKGRQGIVTRRRPFRQSYKRRSYM